MNAGAHGACLADILLMAEGLGLKGDRVQWTPTDLQFAYRTSLLQEQLQVVMQATLQLIPGDDPAVVLADTQKALERRRATQPYHLPSCGSVFRNPEPQKAGALIEQTGLKGYQIGQAQVSPMHANFIVNLGGAQAQDILQLIQTVQARVHDRWGISLHPEVRLLGTFDI
jgi:UDP-N-acetylmuramate dehydrogenase